MLYNHAHDRAREQANTLKRKARSQEDRSRLAELAKRHNAVVDWETNILKRGEGEGENFSIDFSRVLISSNRQPVLFRARLKDMAEQDGVFTAHFAAFGAEEMVETSRPDFPTMMLSLGCSADEAAELTKTNVTRGTPFAVIARIERISRPELKASASPFTSNDEAPSIDIETDSQVLRITGTCIDLLRLPEAEPTGTEQ